MRPALAVFLTALLLAAAAGQAPKLNPRYNLDYNGNQFPQATPQQALESAVKAIQAKRVDYLLAHLTDPAFVDNQVQLKHKGNFEEFVKLVADKLLNDQDALQLLQRFAREGDWEKGEDTASASLKDVKDKVFARKVSERWFLENERKKTEK